MKIPDRDTLERAALDYLGRYASSSENLRQVLMRRLKRAGSAAPPDGADVVAEIVARHLASGLLNDAAYASHHAASLRRRGFSTAGVRYRLAQKGVARDLIDAALSASTPGETPELEAACALVRRRKLGPFRSPASRGSFHVRDLAAMARAGFALDLARRVLAAEDTAALERLAREGDDQAFSGK